MEADGFKICPFCKEKIRQEAVKCRFCGEWLEQREQAYASSCATENVPPPLPIQCELPATDKNKNALLATSKIKKASSSKALFWICISLLFSTGVFWLFWFFDFAAPHWNRLSPGQQGEETVKTIMNLVKIFIPVALITWWVKGKSEKFLAFSVLFAVMTAIFAFYFFDARHKTQEKVAETNRLWVSNINSLEEFLKQGAVGDVPEFKPTGDADNDALFQAMRGFYTEYLQGWRTMRQKLESLQETDVSADLLLTNKAVLESEIRKRIVGQQIIAAFATNAIPMIERFKEKCASLNVSEGFKQGVLKGIDEKAPQYKAMFTAWIGSQKADENMLIFLYDNFEDYELKDGKILFGRITNAQAYDVLAKKVQDASAEVQEFQTQGMAAVAAAKRNLH